ncbi:MAG: RagB/SusD family nutrient uptake outer membrane protein [Ginsengibacter sp.]
MKNFIHKLNISTVLFLVLFSEGCKKSYLEKKPLGYVTQTVLYNKEGADALLIAAYSLLDGSPNNTQNAWSSMNNWIYGGVASDDAHKGTEYGNGPGIEQIESFRADASNRDLLAKWEAVYEGAQRANDVIRLLANIPENSISKDDAQQIKAEAVFLRGVYLTEAAKMWKNVPYVDESIDFASGNYNVPNSGPIWDKIEEDFKYAAANLTDTKGEAGRANSWAAKSFLAKIYMFDHKFSEAQPLLNDIILNGVTSLGRKYALVNNYSDNFDAIKGKNNAETVFATQMSVQDGTGGENGNAADWLIGMYAGPSTCCGYYQPSFSLVNSFKTDAVTGLPLISTFNDFDVKNDMNIKSTEPFTAYEGPLDPRLDHTVGRRGIPYRDWGIHPGYSWIRQQACGGPYSQIKNAYNQADEATTSDGSNKAQTSNNLVLIRFDDVILWAAEVEVEIGSLSNAQEYVNLIRARAANENDWVKTYVDNSDPLKGFTNIPAANYKIGLYTNEFESKGQEFAREAVRFERKLEFGMEGHRFFDLQRWDNGTGYMADAINAYIQHETSVPSYNWLYMNGATFVKGKNEIYAIPLTQIDLSVVDGAPILHQNPNY